MSRVPFKVSARAARLIGRENVSTAQGAITELVKNAYDADASVCSVLFTPRWREVPKVLNQREYEQLKLVLPEIDSMFSNEEGIWRATDSWLPEQFAAIANLHTKVLDLWIIDNGHGMPSKVIESQWMVIGTDTKNLNSKSQGGRVVTGAKGIGRFALDRLGQECELFSAVPNAKEISHWLVDWSDFEGSGKVIGDVEALLETEKKEIRAVYEDFHLDEILPKATPTRNGRSLSLDYSTGTAIRIGLLNDNWDQRDSSRLRETLEALLPPHDRSDFDIFVHDHRMESQSGFIDNFPPDQFDYRMLADVKGDGEVVITLQRQEIDVDRISPTFFELPQMQRFPYRKEDFDAGEVIYKKRMEQLFDKKKDLSSYLAVGPFSFTFYFFKLTNPSGENLERFPQKNFDVNARKRWLSNSGGIRLYRDNFRVRPYGEPGSTTYDWLSMGERSSRNPAAASRPGWRVLPQQVAGTLRITKHDNPSLIDQANREGIINERAFSIFREIVVALIREFEKDRSYILHHLGIAFDIDNPEPADVEEGRKIAETLLKRDEERSSAANESPELDLGTKEANAKPSETSEDKLRQVSRAYGSERRLNETLRDNIQVMRGMATLGTVLVSFTHELRGMRATIDSRHERLSDAIYKVVDDGKLANLSEINSPFRILERLKMQDEKVDRWVKLALSAVSPAKRRRRWIDMDQYLKGVNTYWEEFLKSKSITLEVDTEGGADLSILAHEIDLDSIFYNLINNSVEALVKPSAVTLSRKISIEVIAADEGRVKISYGDNGPGLSSEISVPEDIFVFGITSKKEEASGDAVGTGLGMWLLKNVVDDYGGEVTLNCKPGEPNFSISILLPGRTENERGENG
ncbi:MAG: hypothetical protein CML23_14260 [Rhizobiaceae bacterium]|nr:hypothetical protein [Rhizobiaceae bacterium]|tara:strand:+ start:502 stop:3084 length:2583 start_codon:yes stop_codon:yes gene_type:complete